MLRMFIICLLPLFALSGCGMKTDLVAPSASPDASLKGETGMASETGAATPSQAAKIGNLLLD